MDMFNVVNSVLQIIALDASVGSNRADGDTAFEYLHLLSLYFVLCIMGDIMGISESLARPCKINHMT